MAISIQNITKQFGSQVALDDVNLEIQSNQITALIGPNGAGKSTLMKVICGYYSPSSGKVSINGQLLEEDLMGIRRQIGYLPELNPLYYDLYVKEYLEIVGGIYGVKNLKQRVAEVVELTGLTKEQSKKIEVLSRGYKQRVGIAQAIIHNPSVLILDEPTSGLDPNQIVEIRSLIRELSHNKTVLLSTHLMQEVEAISNHVIILNHGKVIEDSQVNQIKKASGAVAVIEIEFAENQALNMDIIREIDHVDQVKQVAPNHFLIETSKEKLVREIIFQKSVAHQATLLSMQLREATLEEIFQRLTS